MLKYRGDGETYVSKYVEENGYTSMYHPGASVLHYVDSTRMTVQYFSKRSYMQGISDSFSNIRENKFGINFKMMVRKIKDKYRILGKNTLNYLIRKAYWEGYRFHRNEVRKDPELYKWVLKKNYL